MSNHPGFFSGYYRQKEVAHDFEDRVWCKIRRKKKQKTVVRAVVALFFAALIPVGYKFFATSRTAPAPFAQAIDNSSAQIKKEQIPLIENLTFAVSDDRSVFALEPVSYTPPAGNRRKEI